MVDQLPRLYHPLRLSDMNFGEVSAHLHRCSSLIVPVGSMEPFGLYAGYGIVTRCSEALTEALSSRLQVLTAPPLPYSCSTAFKSFEGCAGIRGRTFTNLIMEICRDWIFQGFRRILLISASSENDQPLQQAVTRLNGGLERVRYFSLQSDARIAGQIDQYKKGRESGRSEFLILSLAKYLFPDMPLKSTQAREYPLPDKKEFGTWQKRGKDPQKFRKMFPDGSTSEIAGEMSIDFGGEMFAFILTILEKDNSPFLIAEECS